MAYYLVTAKPKPGRLGGYATWEEEDYCSPPLAQERAPALNEFFDELDIKRVEDGAGWKQIESLPKLFPEVEAGS